LIFTRKRSGGLILVVSSAVSTVQKWQAHSLNTLTTMEKKISNEAKDLLSLLQGVKPWGSRGHLEEYQRVEAVRKRWLDRLPAEVREAIGNSLVGGLNPYALIDPSSFRKPELLELKITRDKDEYHVHYLEPFMGYRNFMDTKIGTFPSLYAAEAFIWGYLLYQNSKQWMGT